jgi:branched-chain amino acid transport system ATP-binding protein
LKADGIKKSFGGIHALRGVSISVNSGEIVGVIGPNGCGKSTLVNCMTGQYRIDAGRVNFLGRDVTGLRPHRILQLGLARTFQTTRLYWDLTTHQNMQVASLWLPKHQVEDRTSQVLELFRLSQVKEKQAALLSTFERRRLEIAMRVLTSPKALLLDEPAAGISPEEMNDLSKNLTKLRDDGVGILLIEHTMRVIFGLSGRVIVLSQGQVIGEGTPQDILKNQAVIDAYIGSWRPGE